MVEFLRDVIVAVAILATLVAVALYAHPAEPDARRGGESPASSRTAAMPLLGSVVAMAAAPGTR